MATTVRGGAGRRAQPARQGGDGGVSTCSASWGSAPRVGSRRAGSSLVQRAGARREGQRHSQHSGTQAAPPPPPFPRAAGRPQPLWPAVPAMPCRPGRASRRAGVWAVPPGAGCADDGALCWRQHAGPAEGHAVDRGSAAQVCRCHAAAVPGRRGASARMALRVGEAGWWRALRRGARSAAGATNPPRSNS
jgi:hypothetical protein